MLRDKDLEVEEKMLADEVLAAHLAEEGRQPQGEISQTTYSSAPNKVITGKLPPSCQTGREKVGLGRGDSR